MAMQIGSQGGDGEPEVLMDMNTTPLIDVMLVLLVMLIITIPIQTHAVKLDMPAGAQAPPVPPPVVTIDVDFDGTLSWNGETVDSEQQLRQRMQAAAALADQPEVHLRPNKLVTYKYVAHVMADAQRLGLKKLGLVGNDQFIGEN